MLPVLSLLRRSPSPRTAKLIMYERMLDWHVDTVSLRPEACRLTHLGCGMSFELREVGAQANAGARARTGAVGHCGTGRMRVACT